MLLLSTIASLGQTRKEFDQEKRNLQKEMSNYIDQTRKEFTDYVDGINKDYSNYLRKNWKSFDLLNPMHPDSAPKPHAAPRFNPVIDKMKIGKEIKLVPKDSAEAMAAVLAPVPFIPIVLPVETHEESPVSTEPKPNLIKGTVIQSTGNLDVQFYGSKLNLDFDSAMNGELPKEIHNTTIADFWDRLNKTNYSNLVRQLASLNTSLNLGDWGFFQLVRKTAKTINSNENYARLLSWFLLTKSGYRIRIAYADNKIAIMFPSATRIYGLRYFVLDNVKFYAPGFTSNQIYTFERDFPGASKMLDLNVFNAMNLGDDYAVRAISFIYGGKEFSVNVEYNRNAVDFYRDFPLCELKLYFDAAVSSRAKESLIKALRPLTAGKSDAETINFLLAFVQKGFSYKADPEQFNEEKYFFPEETLFYPYSDCEDRAILFSYLVRELTDLKVVGLAYPGHVAAAVHFNSDEAGDFVSFKGEKYVVADPTYVDAPLGLTMPGMRNSSAEIIEVQNGKNEKEAITMVWEKTLAAGGQRGENYQTLDRDTKGNYYITGYFQGEMTLGGTTLKSAPYKKDAFLARFNVHGNPEWVISGGCEGNAMATNIRLDADDNIIIGGTFEKSIRFGGIMMFANSGANAFVAKINLDGKLLWMNQHPLDTAKAKNNIFVFSVDNKGKEVKYEKYPNDPNFIAFGISFDKQNNIYYTTTYAYTAGLADKLTLAAESTFNVPAILKEENDKQIEMNCNKAIAGLFGALSLLRNGVVALSGKAVQMAFEQYNPEFKRKSPNLYASLGRISLMKNDQGIITITTEDQKPIGLDRMKICHNTRMKLSIFANGDARIDILGGVKVGKSIIWFNLNYIKLYRANGFMVFDYDSDHSQVTIDVRKDLL